MRKPIKHRAKKAPQKKPKKKPAKKPLARKPRAIVAARLLFTLDEIKQIAREEGWENEPFFRIVKIGEGYTIVDDECKEVLVKYDTYEWLFRNVPEKTYMTYLRPSIFDETPDGSEFSVTEMVEAMDLIKELEAADG